jgi:hypothetical protein
MDRLLHDPSQQLKVKREHDEDEEKLENLDAGSFSLRLRRCRGKSCPAQIPPQLPLESPDIRSPGSA